MPKKNNKGKISRKAKAKNGKTKTRERYTLEVKKQAIKLNQQGMSCDQIHKWFLTHKKMNIPKSTISTWYNSTNLIKLTKVGDLDINNNDTCINQIQRPRIFWDMEAILKTHIQRSQLQGILMTREGVRMCVIKVYERLKKLDIYDDSGAR